MAIILLTAALAASAVAAEATFPLEGIRVDGVRYTSSAVVVAESRLAEGGVYSEAEIHAAVARVRRLPFVIGVRVSLDKGSNRGQYILVLRIEEVKPLFVDYRSVHETFTVQRMDGGTAVPSLLRQVRELPSVGGRVFLTSRTMLAASAELGGGRECCAGDPQYALALTQYDLFGTRTSVAAIVQYREYAFDFRNFPEIGGTTSSFGDHVSWGVTAAVPVFRNQAIRLSAHREQRKLLETHDQVDTFVRMNLYDLQSTWRYDTTDDLLFPDSGAFAEAGIQYRRGPQLRTTRTSVEFGKEWHHSIVATAGKYWEVSPRQSVSAAIVGGGNERARNATITAGYSANLWEGRSADRLRLELNSGVGRSTNTDATAQFTASLAFRNAWGTARFDFGYYGWRPE